MKVLIIEDEKLAEEYLEDLLSKTDYDIQISGKADSVKNAIKWFIKNPQPDLVFMDIDLGDGLCFEVFEVVDINCPIIFTTAYDEYAIQAFKVNSIDYLLKPVDLEGLKLALDKFLRMNTGKLMMSPGIQTAGKMLSKGYKERFIIKIGDHLKTIPVKEIMYFVSREKATFAGHKEGRTYLIDYTLDGLEEILDPSKYFRINRQYIIRDKAILDMVSYSNSRLKVILDGSDDKDIIVARDRVQDFKAWLDK
jgi:DNA-binding LytR/AlgR family response regulator